MLTPQPDPRELPPEMAVLRPRLGDVVEILERKSDHGSVLLSSRHGMNITVESEEESISELPRSAGMVASSLTGGTLFEKSVAGFDPDRLMRAANDLSRNLPGPSNGSPGGSPVPQDFFTAAEIPVSSLTLQDKLERCRELRRRLAALDQRIANARVWYTEYSEASTYRDPTADLAQTIQRVRLQVMVVLADGGEVRWNVESKGGSGGWEFLAYSDEELDTLVRGAARLFSSERIEPGEYAVVSGPGVSGVLAHESFGHGVETDLFPKERARSYDYLGKRVGSDLVSIYDDPSLPGGYSSYFFDDEGMLSSPTAIVEGGIFRRGISDMVSATALGLKRTANGRRQDYTRKPYARMSNTFFGPGTTSLEDLLAQVDQGVFLDRWMNGMEDPQGWGIQITCLFGQEIRNGRLTDRVFAPVSISGYVPAVLKTISAATPEVQMDQGVCGKGHKEYVVNSSGGPYLLLRARLG